MPGLLTILALLGGAIVVTIVALFAARLLRLDRLVANLSSSAAPHEWAVGLLGLIGLAGALVILFKAGFSFGLSTAASSLMLCLCAGFLSMALRPANQRAQSVQADLQVGRREDAPRSKAA